MKVLPLFLLSLMSVLYAQESEIKITQKASGKSLKVKIIELSEGNVRIKNKQGKIFKISLDTLADESVENIKTLWNTLSKNIEDRNTLFGQPLLNDSGVVLKENAKDVAQRLGLQKESSVTSSSSYRLYTDENYLFAGAHPYCVTLYGNKENQAARLSLVFANKGDFGSTVGFGPDHFRKIHPEREIPETLQQAIEIDEEIIKEKLTAGFGEPISQYYGEKEDKRKVLRWNIDSQQAILLSSRDGEYTSLLIVSTENADAGGRVQFVSDQDLKLELLQNVSKKENGDVLIKNIPMVNQGPKGYCAPATFERAMRYMQIPADMYLLATAATATGGGTNTQLLAEKVKRIVRSKARKIRDIDLQDDLTIRKVRKYIDKGVPVLWQMRSLEKYNEITNARTQKREEVEDFTTWAEEIEAEAKKLQGELYNREAHHICMIIGYNSNTHEIAVSDSWGPEFELRWVHLDIAKAVTDQGGFVIDY